MASRWGQKIQNVSEKRLEAFFNHQVTGVSYQLQPGGRDQTFELAAPAHGDPAVFLASE